MIDFLQVKKKEKINFFMWFLHQRILWKTWLIVTWHIGLPSIPPLWHPCDNLDLDPSIPKSVTWLLNAPYLVWTKPWISWERWNQGLKGTPEPPMSRNWWSQNVMRGAEELECYERRWGTRMWWEETEKPECDERIPSPFCMELHDPLHIKWKFVTLPI